MAVRFANGDTPNDRKKARYYIREASQQGYIPAQAMCASIFAANEEDPVMSPEVLQGWAYAAKADGALFGLRPSLSQQEETAALAAFSNTGGYNEDPFVLNTDVQNALSSFSNFAKWLDENGPAAVVDTRENNLLHAAAAFGQAEAVNLILDREPSLLNATNERLETPLCKACRSGQAGTVQLLCQKGARADIKNDIGITPLHWLFAFPDSELSNVTRHLVHNGAQVNDTIPLSLAYPNTPPRPIPWKHFPFSWPYGSALHWAVFASNTRAVDALIEVGADIEIQDNPENRLSTCLGQAVYRADAAMVAHLLKRRADAQRRGKADRNLLHVMSHEAGQNERISRALQQWMYHGTWEQCIKATTTVIRLLVDSGVAIDHQCTAYDNDTPLRQAATRVSKEPHVIYALVHAGARIDAGLSSGETALHSCAYANRWSWPYPQAHKRVMETLIENTADLNAQQTLHRHTALHNVANNKYHNSSEMRESMILFDRSGRANFNALTRDGKTPLMLAYSHHTESACCGEIVLSFGGDAGYTNSKGYNAISSIVSNELLMDADSRHALDNLITHCTSTGMDVGAFVAATNIETLIRACVSGKFRTTEKLLELGMSDKVNDKIKQKTGQNRTVLDLTFDEASRARTKHIDRRSVLSTSLNLAAMDRNGALYSDNLDDPPYQRPRIRDREIYWALPSILHLLISYGAEVGEPKLICQPTFVDAHDICGRGYTKETQPNREHWQILYDLEVLPSDWEQQCWASLHKYYVETNQDGVLVPYIGQYRRWPMSYPLWRPDDEGWCQAKLWDDTDIQFQAENGKIMVARNRHNKRPIALDDLR